MRTINDIIIHCSATKEGRDFRARDIGAWHRQRGWNGIGYHFVIDLDGTVETGRDINTVGAHCQGHNTGSIGICYIGGLDEDGNPKDTRTPEQYAALHKLVLELKDKFGCPVHGHCDYAAKACPCFDAHEEFDT